MWYNKLRDKKTGKIVNVCEMGGNWAKIRDDEGNAMQISVPYDKDYEPVCTNYEIIRDYVIDLCYFSSNARAVFDAIFRRLDPDYYTPGAIVYISSNGPISHAGDNRGYNYEKFGPNLPYVIKKVIRRTENNRDWEEVIIAPKGKETRTDLELTFPKYPDMYTPDDAFSNLIRYDKEQ